MLFFSSFASSIMSAIYGLAIFLIGHSSAAIVGLITSAKSSAVQWVFKGVYYLLPNLEKFNLRNDAVYHIHPLASEVLLTILYAVVFCAIFLYLATLAFRHQEI